MPQTTIPHPKACYECNDGRLYLAVREELFKNDPDSGVLAYFKCAFGHEFKDSVFPAGRVSLREAKKVVALVASGNDYLATCPFCGTQNIELKPWHGGLPTKRWVGCGNDDCHVQPSVTGDTRAIAVRRWNRRAD